MANDERYVFLINLHLPSTSFFTFLNPTIHPIIQLVPSFHHSQKQNTSDTQIVPLGGMEMEKGERSRRLVVGHDPRLQHNAISISPTPPRLHHKKGKKKRQNLPKQWAHTRTTLRAQTKVQSPWLPTRKRQRRGSSSDRRRRHTGRGPSRHRRRAGWWRLRFGAWGFSFLQIRRREPKLTP